MIDLNSPVRSHLAKAARRSGREFVPIHENFGRPVRKSEQEVVMDDCHGPRCEDSGLWVESALGLLGHLGGSGARPRAESVVRTVGAPHATNSDVSPALDSVLKTCNAVSASIRELELRLRRYNARQTSIL